MDWLRELGRRVLMLVRRRRFDTDLEEEMSLHRELREQEQIERGLSSTEARYAAQRRFGNDLLLREASRDTWGWVWIETVWQDFRYSVRQLRKNPGFTAVIVITLALGIGANSAVFSVVNSLFLRALPVPERDRLVSFSDTNFSWTDYLAYRDEAKSFESLSASYAFPFTANLNSTRPPQHIYGGLVTGNFLITLGIRPALGRGFLPDEDQISSPKAVVILSYRFWRSRFGGDPQILGKAIRLDNANYTVVGVMPSELRTVDFGVAPDLWAPMAALPQLDAPEAESHAFSSDEQGFWIFGRLKRGISRRAAQAEVNLIHDRLRQAAGEKDIRPIALASAGVLPGGFGRLFLGVSAVVVFVAAFVLLIACVNIANLLLARGTAQRREIGVRLAIGASRARIVRQLMTMNLILAALGAAAGLFLAWAATRVLARIQLPLDMPIALNFAPDSRVVLITAGIAVLTGLLFGLAPAARSARFDVNASLKDGDTTSTGLGSGRVRNGLVMVQVAVSVIVLIAAALFLHSLRNGFSMDLGFRPENLLIVRLDTTAQGYSKERTALFFQQLEEQVNTLAGVRSASIVAPLPLGIYSSGSTVTVPGTSRSVDANRHMVGPRYFETLGIPLLKGRSFRDVPVSSPPVAIINHALAELMFPNENPIGQRLSWEFGHGSTTFEIAGVAGDAKSKTIGEALTPCLFELAAQNPKGLQLFSPLGISLVVRTLGEPMALASAVQKEVERLDPDLPVYGVETMEEQVGKSLVVARLAASFLSISGLLALALATVGLYGLMSYTVAGRTREVAIRMALGASANNALGLLARQGLTVIAIGLFAGLVGSLAVGRLVSSLLYGIGSVDQLAFVCVPLVLAAVASAAILLPARRATRVDLMEALRFE